MGSRLALGARNIALGDTSAYFSGPIPKRAVFCAMKQSIAIQFGALGAGNQVEVRSKHGFELSADKLTWDKAIVVSSNSTSVLLVWGNSKSSSNLVCNKIVCDGLGTITYSTVAGLVAL